MGESRSWPRLAVLGIGYAGLPLAVAAAAIGYRTWGVDTDPRVVAQVNDGISHVDTVGDGELTAVRERLTATTDPACLSQCSVIVICVPTPVDADGQPNLTALTAAAVAVRDALRPGQLVIVESTTYPGTTDGHVRGLLEESGLRAGVDFSLAYSPERVDPGNPVYRLGNTPKLVGGLTPVCRDRATAFYSRFVQHVHPTPGTREAEAAKIFENTYRQVNIALVNEFARFCHAVDIDVWETLRAVETKPFGFSGFRPSAGVGGHCIPVDPLYLVHRAHEVGLNFHMAETAQSVNEAMPGWVAERAAAQLAADGTAPRDARVLLLGATYKRDVADARNAPCVELASRLRTMGTDVAFHDPHICTLVIDGVTLHRAPDVDEAVRVADLVVVVQHHKEYGDDLLGRARRIFYTSEPAELPNGVSL
uniref:Nucleotide sugar dehydrogenase n=1 Tax=Streptomyces sp. FR1 TaxID=349971 RepID=V9Z288_9ACTN|nr:nucleotide sugar dehydrogenase [Streptomyces sp. FR1]AHE38682.1 Nucleotide sugar dehydrogenase [Streptomyces sp. FR1]